MKRSELKQMIREVIEESKMVEESKFTNSIKKAISNVFMYVIPGAREMKVVTDKLTKAIKNGATSKKEYIELFDEFIEVAEGVGMSPEQAGGIIVGLYTKYANNDATIESAIREFVN